MVPPPVRALSGLRFRCRPTLRVPTTRAVAFGVRLLCNRLPQRHLPSSRLVPTRSCLSRLPVTFRLPHVRQPPSTCAARPYSERWPPRCARPDLRFRSVESCFESSFHANLGFAMPPLHPVFGVNRAAASSAAMPSPFIGATGSESLRQLRWIEFIQYINHAIAVRRVLPVPARTFVLCL